MLKYAALLLAASTAVYAQTPAFDVASLKPVQPAPPYPIDLGNSGHGQLTLTNVTLGDCLKFAFNIRNDSQISGPEWIKSRSDLFSIVGQAPAEIQRDQLRLMTQTLLTERFGLLIHHEPKELPYEALVVDRKGLKVHESKNGADTASSNVRSGRIEAKVTMATLALFLARFTRTNVVDLTELKGAYDVHLEWMPENLNTPKPDADITGGPSIYAAVREQLGLRLEGRKGPFDVIVIDHAERKPREN